MNIKDRAGISLVIPVFNNTKTVATGIRACIGVMKSLGKPYEIIIGEDVSTDSTREILRKNFSKTPRVHICFHTKNLGISRNIYFLYSQARLEYTALFSVDGEWNTGDLRNLILQAYRTHSDIVVGKRENKEGYTWERSLISNWFRRLTRLFFRVDTVDAGSIKVFKTIWFRDGSILSRSHFFEAELIIRIVKSGGLLTSCPVRYSKQSVSSGGWKWITRAAESFGELLQLYCKEHI